MSISEQLDAIYDKCDELMQAGKWDELDIILSEISIRDTSTDILLGYLTASLPGKSKLPSRFWLYDMSKIELDRRGEDTYQLLKGLR